MSSIDLESLFDNLSQDQGVYRSKNSNSQIDLSYPEEGYLNLIKLEENSFWFKHRNKCILNFVKRYNPNDIFFDIGGGSGAVANFLQQNDIRTILIEPAYQGALAAAKRNLTTVCDSFENLHPTTSINAVGLFDVIEHIENDQIFLNKINKFLSDNGYIYITVPAYKWLWSEEDDYAGHYRRYNLKTLKQILEQANFKVLHSSYFFCPLILPILLFRVIPSLIGLRKNNLQQNLNEHNTNRLSAKIMNILLKIEFAMIKGYLKIPFGASCILVAQKKV